MRRHRGDGIAVVERRLERLDGGSGVARLVEAAVQLLRLAAEHAAAYQVQAARRLVEPDFLEGLHPRLGGVVTPAHGEKALRRAVHGKEALRPAPQGAAARLRAHAV